MYSYRTRLYVDEFVFLMTTDEQKRLNVSYFCLILFIRNIEPLFIQMSADVSSCGYGRTDQDNRRNRIRAAEKVSLMNNNDIPMVNVKLYNYS